MSIFGSEIEQAEFAAHRLAEHKRIAEIQRGYHERGEHGYGRTAMVSIPFWHLRVGMFFDKTSHFVQPEDGGILKVVGTSQHDKNWNWEYVLVENAHGERRTLTSAYKSYWTVNGPSYMFTNEYFTATYTG